MQAFGKEGNYWISADELIDNTEAEDSLADGVAKLLIQFLQDLQNRSITQEILRWELLKGNQLAQELAKAREQTTIECLDFLERTYLLSPDRDMPAITAIFIAGIVYLVLRSQLHPSFLGIDLTSAAGWSRIEEAIASMSRATLGDEQEFS